MTRDELDFWWNALTVAIALGLLGCLFLFAAMTGRPW